MISLFLSGRQGGPSGSRSKSRGGFGSFADASSEHVKSLAQHVTHPGGSVIFKEGHPAKDVYVVHSGQLKLFASSNTGHTMIARIAKPGDVLGLSAALNNLPYEVTAQTLDVCILRHIGRRALLRFLKTYAEAGYVAAVALAREHRELFFGTRRLTLSPSAAARIAQVLIEFASSAAMTKWSDRSFPMLLTHAELGSMVGASRETITRVLNRLERDGIISRDDSGITILQPAQLEQLATEPSDF